MTEDFRACVLISLLFTEANVILTCGSLLPLLDLYTCVSPCESVGLGCYWVDNSELRKRKRTSLWHLLTLVTLLDFSLQLSQPALYPNAPNSSSVTAFFPASHRWAPPPRLFCTHRTALRPWRRPSQNAPQSSLSLKPLTLGENAAKAAAGPCRADTLQCYASPKQHINLS